MSRGRHVGDFPGTFQVGYAPAPLVSFRVEWTSVQPDGVRNIAGWYLGECKVLRFRDGDGVHLTVSHPERYPTWDEIKTARYRLLPRDRTFALLLPPPAEYVDDPRNPNVFELVEVWGIGADRIV